jgi:PII-like signaling protein
VPNLPVVIEVVDTQEKIAEIVPELERLAGEGLITIEAAAFLRLGP